MSTRVIFMFVMVTAMLVPLSSQVAFGQWNARQRTPQSDTVAGGIAGAIIGGIVGNQNDETPEGIVIGAAVGALTGNVIGNSRQQSQREQYAYQQQLYQRQIAQQQIQQQAFQRAASVDDIITMSQNGIGSAVIENHLRTVGVQSEVGVSEIIKLHRAGVDQRVITLMQRIGSGQQTVAAPVVQQAYVTPVARPTSRVVVERNYVVPARQPCPYDAQRRWEAERAYRSQLNYRRY